MKIAGHNINQKIMIFLHISNDKLDNIIKNLIYNNKTIHQLGISITNDVKTFMWKYIKQYSKMLKNKDRLIERYLFKDGNIQYFKVVSSH